MIMIKSWVDDEDMILWQYNYYYFFFLKYSG